MESLVLEYEPLAELFSKLTPRVGDLSYNYVITLVEGTKLCTGCKKKLRVGTYFISFRTQSAGYCNVCASKLLDKGYPLLAPKVKKLKADLLRLFDSAYKRYVVDCTTRGIQYYKDPRQALQGVLENGIVVTETSTDVTIQLKESNKKQTLTKEEYQLGVYYILLRILNTNSKYNNIKSQPFGLYILDGAYLHTSSYLEDIFCPVTYTRLKATTIYTEGENTYTLYESPTSWGKKYILKNYSTLTVE